MFHTSLNVNPKSNEDGYFLSYSDIQLLINPIDTKLSKSYRISYACNN